MAVRRFPAGEAKPAMVPPLLKVPSRASTVSDSRLSYLWGDSTPTLVLNAILKAASESAWRLLTWYSVANGRMLVLSPPHLWLRNQFRRTMDWIRPFPTLASERASVCTALRRCVPKTITPLLCRNEPTSPTVLSDRGVEFDLQTTYLPAGASLLAYPMPDYSRPELIEQAKKAIERSRNLLEKSHRLLRRSHASNHRVVRIFRALSQLRRRGTDRATTERL